MTCFVKGDDRILPHVSYIGMFSYPFWLALCFVEPQCVEMDMFVILSHENRFALGPKKGIKYLIFLSVIG